MRNTQSVPACPQCGARVYRTHTCRASGLRLGLNGKLPEPGEVLPAARPLALVPMPEGWRDQVAEATATWPARAQLDLVTDDDLDWPELCGLDACELGSSCQARGGCEHGDAL